MKILERFSKEYPEFGVYYSREDRIGPVKSDVYYGSVLNIRIKKGKYQIHVRSTGLPENIIFSNSIDVKSIDFTELSCILRDLVEKYSIDNYTKISVILHRERLNKSNGKHKRTHKELPTRWI